MYLNGVYLSEPLKPFALLFLSLQDEWEPIRTRVDLVAVRGDISFLVEIKTSSTPTLHFSTMAGKLQQQAITMLNLCEKTTTLPVYAFRLKRHRGDSWRIFTMEHNTLQGRLRILHQRLPQLDKSASGNFIMRWDQGMQLSDFLEYLCK